MVLRPQSSMNAFCNQGLGQVEKKSVFEIANVWIYLQSLSVLLKVG